MSHPISRSANGIIAQAEKLLAELGGVEAIAEGSSFALPSMNIVEPADVALRALSDAASASIPGHLELSVSDDEMSAVMDFMPPSGAAPPLDPDDVRRIVSANHITFDIDWNAIEEALFTCNTDRRVVSAVTIAKGRAPVNEVPEHFVVDPGLSEHPRASSGNERERVDYREVSPFTLVKRGDVLARRFGRVKGVFGSTVRGKAVPFQVVDSAGYTLGQNVVVEDDVAVAASDGKLSIARQAISVNPVLQIPHDVDFRTGHVSFSGDVVVNGDIKTGFKVSVGGGLMCLQSIEAADVQCDGDLVVKRGIIGKETGRTRAGGSLHAKFAENAILEAKETIRVEVGILNSIVRTQSRVETGFRGMIVGGRILAGKGVSAAQIGSSLGPRTEISCGIDYSVEQKLEWLQEKAMQLTVKLKEITSQLMAVQSRSAELEHLQEKLKAALHSVNDAASQLLFKLDRDESADVRVSGTVFPGTYIEICHRPYIVTKPLVRPRFRLDKEKGKVVVEKW